MAREWSDGQADTRSEREEVAVAPQQHNRLLGKAINNIKSKLLSPQSLTHSPDHCPRAEEEDDGKQRLLNSSMAPPPLPPGQPKGEQE